MAKYSFEFKQKVVQAYLNGEGGWRLLAQKYGIPSIAPIQRWVAAYQTYGSEGLLRSRKNEIYSFDFKLHVVELYLTTEVSYQELALSIEMNNPTLIAKWVNDFRIAGPDALRAKRKGRHRQMDKTKATTLDTPAASNDNADYIRQLEDELLKLKIENAYLKELRRLRLEETPQNKKRELFTVSEDYSN